MRFVKFFLLDLIEGRVGLCEWGGEGVGGNASECLSTNTLLPSAETGTLWEQACSGVFHVQCTESELRGGITFKAKHKQ